MKKQFENVIIHSKEWIEYNKTEGMNNDYLNQQIEGLLTEIQKGINGGYYSEKYIKEKIDKINFYMKEFKNKKGIDINKKKVSLNE